MEVESWMLEDEGSGGVVDAGRGKWRTSWTLEDGSGGRRWDSGRMEDDDHVVEPDVVEKRIWKRDVVDGFVLCVVLVFIGSGR